MKGNAFIVMRDVRNVKVMGRAFSVMRGMLILMEFVILNVLMEVIIIQANAIIAIMHVKLVMVLILVIAFNAIKPLH